jgi:hypothetical protein
MPAIRPITGTTVLGSVFSATEILQPETLPSLISSVANIAIVFQKANLIWLYLNYPISKYIYSTRTDSK